MNEFTVVNKCIGLFARRCSGKSFLLRYLLSNEKHEFDKVFVICPTESINHFYSGLIPEDCIFDKYDDVWVGKLIEKLTELHRQNKTSSILLVLDDCIADSQKFHNSPNLEKVLVRGRHIGLAVMITTQHVTGIPPIVRNNLDYIFCGQMNRHSVEILSDEFLAGDLDKAGFIKLYNQSTKDYTFFVINASSVEDNGDLNQIYGTIKTPPEFLKKKI